MCERCEQTNATAKFAVVAPRRVVVTPAPAQWEAHVLCDPCWAKFHEYLRNTAAVLLLRFARGDKDGPAMMGGDQ
jgi:hypothetical protein